MEEVDSIIIHFLRQLNMLVINYTNIFYQNIELCLAAIKIYLKVKIYYLITIKDSVKILNVVSLH